MTYINPADLLPDPEVFLRRLIEAAKDRGYEFAAAEFVDCGNQVALAVTKSGVSRAARRNLPCDASDLVSELNVWFSAQEAA